MPEMHPVVLESVRLSWLLLLVLALAVGLVTLELFKGHRK